MSYTVDEVRSYAALFWNGPSKDDKIASDMLHKYADLLESARPEALPTIVRNGGDGQLDEVVAEDCDFHIEQMDDGHWWIGVNAQDRFFHINLTSKGRIKALIESEERHRDSDDGTKSITSERHQPQGERKDG